MYSLFFLQRAYKKDAVDNFEKFSHVVDTPEIVLAKANAINQSDVSIYFLKVEAAILSHEPVFDGMSIIHHGLLKSWVYSTEHH